MTKDEALKIALEALETALDFDIDAEDGYYLQAITAIKEALAQEPEQEPVAWPCLIAEADFSQDTVTLKMQCNDYKVSSGKHWLYTTPPQRTWVGLAAEDRLCAKYMQDAPDGIEAVIDYIEAKLKELNT